MITITVEATAPDGSTYKIGRRYDEDVDDDVLERAVIDLKNTIQK